MNQKEKESPYILIGNGDEDTHRARTLLDEAAIEYRFAYCRVMEGPLPQLVSGLTTFVGLGQIAQVAARVSNKLRTPPR